MIYKIRVRDADDFDPKTLVSQELRNGLTAIFGRLKPEEPDPDEVCAIMPGMPMMPGMPPPAVADPTPRPMRLQALHFDGAQFTLEKAFDWMSNYGYRVERLEFARQWHQCDGTLEQMSAPEAYEEHEADLFEAGSYPDRNLTVTQADIQRLASITTPIPIRVGHEEPKARVGDVIGLHAAGDWLKGKIRMLPEAWALLDRIGLKGLSVAVSRALDSIDHIAVTGTPRVADARMFSGDSGLVLFSLGEHSTRGKSMGNENETVSTEQFAQLQAQFAAMQASLTEETAARVAAEGRATESANRADSVAFALRVKDATAHVDSLAKKLPPVARAEAIALLLSDATVKFSEGTAESVDRPVAEVFKSLCAKLPDFFARPLRGEADVASVEQIDMTPEQRKILREHFADLDPKALAANLTATFAEKGA